MKSLQSKKAILVVSFGTSYHDTRKVTIDAIEQEIATAYPDYKIYRAWTSGMILQKLKKRDNIHYDTVKEAMVRMKNEGITDVIVQPTHVINGIENELMIQDALFYSSSFSTIRFGTPLLTTTEDNDIVIEAIHKQFSYLTKEEALVLMGHGTTHYSNSIYAALDYTFKDKGYQNIFVGTVEAYPTIDSVLSMVKQYAPKRVHLAPFMIVSGDHATNDMAGDDIDSWKTQFLSAGYDVQCHLKGLGEYEEIRDLFLKHILDVIISMDDKTTV
ncbi:MAG: sirohydrochlorin cobaltochelatase [Clostridiales bacterium]|nr:sirohydrochlorin cobaltochelatase [Clostridiales bacterium]